MSSVSYFTLLWCGLLHQWVLDLSYHWGFAWLCVLYFSQVLREGTLDRILMSSLSFSNWFYYLWEFSVSGSHALVVIGVLYGSVFSLVLREDGT